MTMDWTVASSGEIGGGGGGGCGGLLDNSDRGGTQP